MSCEPDDIHEQDGSVGVFVTVYILTTDQAIGDVLRKRGVENGAFSFPFLA